MMKTTELLPHNKSHDMTKQYIDKIAQNDKRVSHLFFLCHLLLDLMSRVEDSKGWVVAHIALLVP